MHYNHQKKKKKEKEGLGGSQHSLARTEATEKWAAFYFNSLLAHPTLALLVVSQRGPHSHFSTLLCSLFFVFVTFSIQSLAQLSRPFISESCSHIAQSESYFTHQTTHLPSVTPPPCSALHPHNIHYYLKEWIIFRDKSTVGTEWMVHGRNEKGKHLKPKVCLMKNFCFEVQSVVLPTHLPVE